MGKCVIQTGSESATKENVCMCAWGYGGWRTFPGNISGQMFRAVSKFWNAR